MRSIAPLRALFVLDGAILGVFYPFVPVILAARGFGPEGVGLVTAISSLCFTFAVPVWGHVADVELGRARTLQLAIVGSTLAVLGLLIPLPLLVVGLCIVVYSVFESAFQPLSDALAINALTGARSSDRYARVRLGASVGFSLASIGAGALYDATGYGPASILWAALGIGMFATLFLIPDLGRARLTHAGGPGTRAPRGGSFGYALRVQPRLGPILAGLALVHVGIIAGFTFLALRILELGGQPSDVALSAGLSAAAEVPMMFLMPRIIGKVGLRASITGAMLLYAACMASWAFLTVPAALIATRLVTGVAFAAMAVSAVMVVARILPSRLQATGQGLLQTVEFGIAAVVANGLGGVIFGRFGAPALFLIVAAIAAVGTVVAWSVVPGPNDHVPVPVLPDEEPEALATIAS